MKFPEHVISTLYRLGLRVQGYGHHRLHISLSLPDTDTDIGIHVSPFRAPLGFHMLLREDRA